LIYKNCTAVPYSTERLPPYSTCGWGSGALPSHGSEHGLDDGRLSPLRMARFVKLRRAHGWRPNLLPPVCVCCVWLCCRRRIRSGI